MGRIEQDRVNCPCPQQVNRAEIRTANFQVQYFLPMEPQDHNQPNHRKPVNGLVMIFRFFW